MKVNILGPTTTDSYNAAKNQLVKYDYCLKLHNSFDSFIPNLKNIIGEYIFLPTAYRDIDNGEDWIDFNFSQHKNLKIIDVFFENTLTMALVENKNYKINTAIIHPATKIFIENYFLKDNIDANIIYEKSKYSAYLRFKEDEARFTITSSNLVDNEKYEIIENYNPQMIWVLYKVIEYDVEC